VKLRNKQKVQDPLNYLVFLRKKELWKEFASLMG
jgi:hypothetical protein